MSDIKLPSGKACIAKLSFKPKKGPERKAKATDFYEGSFKLVPIPGPKNTTATILVGCPKMADRGWFPTKGKRITDRQGIERMIIGSCEFTGGKDRKGKSKKGKGATKGYLKIQKPVGGRCRAGYKLKAFKPVARPKKKK